MTTNPNVEVLFGAQERPPKHALVVHDGVDELDKKDAEARFDGMSWQDLQATLGDAGAPAKTFLEEWAVLTPEAQRYYVQGFVAHLLEILEVEEPDGEYVSFFLFHLQEVHRRQGGSPFNASQRAALAHVCLELRQIADTLRFKEWGDDIRRAAQDCAELLRR